MAIDFRREEKETKGRGIGIMPRMRRLKYRDPGDGYYHVISRTVLKSFLLDDNAREKFLSILRKLARVYFVKVVTFSLMSNHFHLIVRMLPDDDFAI